MTSSFSSFRLRGKEGGGGGAIEALAGRCPPSHTSPAAGLADLADETESHGQDAFLEVLVRTLDMVHLRAAREGLNMPEHLVIQSDNPTNQAKNSVTGLFLALLVQTKRFLTCTLNFLTVGHTHEDVDQIFGIICERLRSAGHWDTPAALARIIHEGMAEHFRACGMGISVEEFGATRYFHPWISQCGCELYNAFAQRSNKQESLTPLHSFSYKRREHLFPEEKAMLTAGSTRSPDAPGASDVFCLTKVYMHETKLHQPPLMVLPGAKAGLVLPRAGPSSLKETRECPHDKRRSDLRDMAQELRNPANRLLQYYLPATADYYDALVQGSQRRMPARSVFLASSRCVGRGIQPTGNEQFPHLPHSAWRLMVRFKEDSCNRGS